MSTATRYLLDYSDDAATLVRVLPAGARVADVARASRVAVETFLVSADRWSKREVARWLVGDYRAATAFTGEEGEDEAPPPSSRSGSVVQDEALRRIVSGALGEVIAARRQIALGGGASRTLVERAKACGWVVAICDAEGRRGYAPRALGVLTLAERLLSLLVAGYLSERREDDSCEEPPSTTGMRRRFV